MKLCGQNRFSENLTSPRRNLRQNRIFSPSGKAKGKYTSHARLPLVQKESLHRLPVTSVPVGSAEPGDSTSAVTQETRKGGASCSYILGCEVHANSEKRR